MAFPAGGGSRLAGWHAGRGSSGGDGSYRTKKSIELTHSTCEIYAIESIFFFAMLRKKTVTQNVAIFRRSSANIYTCSLLVEDVAILCAERPSVFSFTLLWRIITPTS